MNYESLKPLVMTRILKNAMTFHKEVDEELAKYLYDSQHLDGVSPKMALASALAALSNVYDEYYEQFLTICKKEEESK